MSLRRGTPAKVHQLEVIRALVAQLDGAKSTGPVKAHQYILKLLSAVTLEPLTVFNLSLSITFIPVDSSSLSS